MKLSIKFMIAAVLCLAPFSVFAFGNEDVIKLTAAGFTEDVVLKAVSTADSPTFDTSADGLIELKKAGVSDAVIQQVLLRKNESRASNQVSSWTPTFFQPPIKNDDQCQLEIGMGNKASVRLEGKIVFLPSPETEMVISKDIGSVFANAFSFGLAKIQTVGFLKINGERSSTRTTEKTPEFLDLFVPFGALPEKTLFLARLTVKEQSRVVQAALAKTSFGVLTDASRDFGENTLVPLMAEKIRDQCTWGGKLWTQYKMKPVSPLEKGEYGFLTFLFGDKIYDFGVD